METNQQELIEAMKLEEAAKQAKIKELNGKLKSAQKALMESTPDKLMENFNLKVQAERDLELFLDSIVSPEEREAEKAYREAKAASDAANAVTAEKLALLKKFRPDIKVKDRIEGSHAPSLTYEKAQAIRKLISEGEKTMQEIADEFEITTSTVNCVRLYINWKLREGDPEYTPLKNSKFPLGAPYAKVG